MTDLIHRSADFFGAEVRVYHGGPFAFFAKLADGLMEEAGGIPPFAYRCEAAGFQR